MVRDKSPEAKHTLQVCAAQNGRSRQTEALAIISDAVCPQKQSWAALLRENAQSVGGMEFELPRRHEPRFTAVDI